MFNWRKGAWACLLNVVHLIDGLVGVVLRRKADETEAAATASITVLDNDLFDVRR